MVGVAQAAEPSDATPPIGNLQGATFRAASLADMRAFWGKGAGFRELPGRGGALRLAVGSDQFLAFEPGALKEYVVRLQSVTLTTPSLRALEASLRDRGVSSTTVAGTLELRDPIGHRLRFVEAPKRKPASNPAPGFSQHLQHVGLVVPRELEPEAERFYASVLGLPEVFRMSDQEGRPGLIKYHLPGDRGDVVELIFTSGTLNKWAAGSAYHVNFSVDDIDAAYCRLFRGGIADQDRHFPKVNAERLWAVDVIDPEQTRLEVQVPTKAAQEIGATSNPACAPAAEPVKLFDGQRLDGWTGEEGIWRVEQGELVGEAKGFLHASANLWHDALVKDFRLSLWVKQTPSEHRAAGIQFRTQHVGVGNAARGYQAPIGPGLWGHLVHEGGREHLFRTDAGDAAAKADDWNHVEILAVGHRIWTAINGALVSAVEDPKGELTGHLALQLHPGGAQAVRFRRLELVRNPPIELAGLGEAELVQRLRPATEEKTAKPR